MTKKLHNHIICETFPVALKKIIITNLTMATPKLRMTILILTMTIPNDQLGGRNVYSVSRIDLEGGVTINTSHGYE